MTPEFDIIIVGSGPAGVSAAFPLVESGLKVLMVDGGGQSDISLPAKPFLDARAEDADQWEWMIGKGFHALKMQQAVSPKFRVPTQGYVFEGFGVANKIESKEFVAVGSLASGGLSNAWGCGVSCLSSEELARMPFNASTLECSYENVARRIGISGPQDDDLSEYFRLDAWVQPPIPIDNLHTHLYDHYMLQRKDLLSSGFRLGKTRNAVLSEDHAGRKACDRLGNCLWGCHRRATYSAADEIGLLRQFKNFHYESGFIVDGLIRNKACWSIEGQQLKSCVQRSISTRKVLMAAGTLATSRLVLKTLRTSAPVPLLSSPTAAFLLWIPRFLGASRPPFFGLGQLSFSLAIQANINGFGTTLSTTGIPVSEFARYLPLGRRYAIDILGSLMSSCLVGNVYLPGNLSNANVALKSDGWQADRAHFETQGLDLYEPFEFSRLAGQPDGTEVTVGFKLTIATHPEMPWAIFFTCDHQHEPRYFYKSPFQSHANTAIGIAEVMMVAEDPGLYTSYFEGLIGKNCVTKHDSGLTIDTGSSVINVIRHGELYERFLGAPNISDGDTRMIGYGIHVQDIETTEKVIQASGINYQRRGKSLWFSAPETSNVIIEFSETSAVI